MEMGMDKQRLLEAIFGEPWPQNTSLPEDSVVEQVLATLHPQEKFVLEHRFADKPLTLKQVAEICPRLELRLRGMTLPPRGVCPERVRQLQAKALRKLRSHSRRVLWGRT